MAIKKEDKVKLVDDIRRKFEKAGAVFVAEYQGIKAVSMTEMRGALRASNVELKVIRNTLAKRAIKGTDAEALSAHLKGPMAVAFSYKDAAAAAKKLTEFAKEQPNLKIRAGALGAKLLGAAEIKGLAELPPREVLLGKLLGSMKSPASGIVVVLSGVPRKLLYALDAIRQAKAAEA